MKTINETKITKDVERDNEPFSDLMALQFAAEGIMNGTIPRADADAITNAIGKRIAFYALQLRSIEVQAVAEAQGRKISSIKALEVGKQ